MKSDRLDEVAARVLREEAGREAPVSAADRAAAIDGMVRAMRRRRRQRIAIFGSVMLAAAALVVLGLASPRRLVPVGVVVATGPVSGATSGAPSSANSATAMRQVVGDGTPLAGTMSLPNGTRVVLDADSTCLLAAAFPATTFELTSGVLHADVAHLGPNERFIVRTPDAEVEVRGTSFDVARVAPDPTCGGGTGTRVVVREGVVAVRPVGQPEALVHAGETWPVCDSPTVAASSSVAPTIAVAPPRSDLAAQNDLFERALAKKRTGDTPGAIAGFDQFLARYPASHLAQSARAERMKLLVGSDRERARAAARDYLQRYPTGFARADAELILSSSN